MMEHLRLNILRGDAAAISACLLVERREKIIAVKDAVLHEVTQAVLKGETPFCQLVAVCQAAQPLYDCTLPPIACCGALAGCMSFATQQFMVMLLRSWGVPTLDMGLNNSADKFLCSVRNNELQFIICTAFTAEEALSICEIDQKAAALGLRRYLKLMLGGITPKTVLPVDNTDFRIAAIAEEVAAAWKK